MPKDESAADQVVGGVKFYKANFVNYMTTKPKIGRGLERDSPEKGTEILALAPRGAAGAKPLQCTQV